MSIWAALPLWAQMLIAAVTAWGVAAMAGPWTVGMLAGWGQRQRIREDAPGRHQQKAGTPTMGGLLIIVAIAVGALAGGGPDAVILFGLAAIALFGAIGLLDDVLAIRRNRNLGLRARERLAAQIGGALVLGWVLSRQGWASNTVAIPWAGTVDLAGWYVVLAALLIVGFGNAVNLTDGLDGLAAGLMAIAALGFAVLAYMQRLPAAALAMAVAAASVGFLRVNAHPARVFMGDVGSNALGAGLAALALLTKAEAALFVIGGVFVAEAASVFLQVAYFQSTGGKRIFRMSPLHHHFELAGWPETTVVRRFYWAGSLCCLLGLLVARA